LSVKRIALLNTWTAALNSRRVGDDVRHSGSPETFQPCIGRFDIDLIALQHKSSSLFPLRDGGPRFADAARVISELRAARNAARRRPLFSVMRLQSDGGEAQEAAR
jgi:hypothetical protein